MAWKTMESLPADGQTYVDVILDAYSDVMNHKAIQLNYIRVTKTFWRRELRWYAGDSWIRFTAPVLKWRFSQSNKDYEEMDHVSIQKGAVYTNGYSQDLHRECEPWSEGRGDPPDPDSPLSGVFDAGVTYTAWILAQMLDVKRWDADLKGDDYDGDIRATLKVILEMGGVVLDFKRSKEQHPDDKAVDEFATIMKKKLAAARTRGRGGWDDPETISLKSLRNELDHHVADNDMVDTANLAMMIHMRRLNAIPSQEEWNNRVRAMLLKWRQFEPPKESAFSQPTPLREQLMEEVDYLLHSRFARLEWIPIEATPPERQTKIKGIISDPPGADLSAPMLPKVRGSQPPTTE